MTPPHRPTIGRVALGFWSLGLSGAFAAVIASALVVRIPNIVDTPIQTAGPGWGARAVPMVETGGPQPPVYISWLRTSEPFLVVQHPEIRILFATYGERVRLRHASLDVIGTSCAFQTPANAQIENNATLAFVRGDVCNPLRQVPSGELKLTVELESRHAVAVWTYDRRPADSAKAGEIEVMGLPTRAGPYPVLRGKYADPVAGIGARRIELLNYMWASSGSVAWIWTGVAASSLLLCVGLWLVAARAIVGRAIGTACLAAAAAVLWAVLIPPLQGADEPDHLLSFAALVGIDIEPELRRLSQQVHFSRIAFDGNEHFRPSDREHPDPAVWDVEIHAEDTARRSPLTALLWRGAARLFHPRGAPPFQTLWRLRLLHASIFAWAAGLSALLIQSLYRGSGRQWALIGLGIAPTVPYFATMVSDWALFVSISVLWSAAIVVTWADGAAVAGLLLGGSFGLLAATSIAALPLAPLLAAVLVGRIVWGGRNEGEGVQPTLIYWGGVATGLACGFLIAANVYRIGYFRTASTGVSLELVTALNRYLGTIAAHAWLLLIPLALGGGAEILRKKTMRGSRTMRLVARRGLAGLVVLAAASLVAILATSVFTPLPTLATLESLTFTSPSQYVQAVIVAVLTSLRVENFDLLTYTTFWSGFGWLDVSLPGWLLGVFAVTSVGAFVLLAQRLVRDGESGRIGSLVLVLAGTLASVVAYAVAGYYMERNVHGRYLIALYLALLLVVWQGVALQLDRPEVDSWKRFLGPGIMGALVAIHAYSFVYVLQRFF
jgi:hypothetical protein